MLAAVLGGPVLVRAAGLSIGPCFDPCSPVCPWLDPQVESSTAKAAEMALKLQTVHRWWVPRAAIVGTLRST